MSGFQDQIDSFQADFEAVQQQLAAVLVGMEEVTGQVLSCVLSGGHGLLEGPPGLGKTLLVRTLGEALSLATSRVQFTPDLMPADITGSMMLATDPAGARSMHFQPGPIFANLVLADEINRATPKTQSAVLEAMQEQTVTVGPTSHPLPQPFCVLATQNPIELEGTYPLPEAQIDRFAMKIVLAPPGEDVIAEVLMRTTGAEIPSAEPVLDAQRIAQHRRTVRQVEVADPIRRLIAAIVGRSQPGHPDAPEEVRRYVRYGCSPRGAQAVLLAAKVAALRAGRANVADDDVRRVLLPCLRHRLILNFHARSEMVDPDHIVTILSSLHLP
jgi:MoxR-like ATPase